jgi:pilus assembly protein Flp/PilA
MAYAPYGGDEQFPACRTLRVRREKRPWWVAMKKLLVCFWKDESAATAIEYGLIAAGISMAIIAVVSNVGTKLKSSFTSISTQLK